jgi:hypothetical protein
MENRDLTIYRVITGLLTVLVLGGASQYFFNHGMVVDMFQNIEYPSYLIYPMGVAKTLGVIAIWTNKSKTLKEWAYAGFVFNFLLGVSAHLNVSDGEFGGALVALILTIASYFYNRKVYSEDYK